MTDVIEFGNNLRPAGELTAAEVERLTKPVTQQYLRGLGLKISGTAPELTARLLEALELEPAAKAEAAESAARAAGAGTPACVTAVAALDAEACREECKRRGLPESGTLEALQTRVREARYEEWAKDASPEDFPLEQDAGWELVKRQRIDCPNPTCLATSLDTVVRRVKGRFVRKTAIRTVHTTPSGYIRRRKCVCRACGRKFALTERLGEGERKK